MIIESWPRGLGEKSGGIDVNEVYRRFVDSIGWIKPGKSLSHQSELYLSIPLSGIAVDVEWVIRHAEVQLITTLFDKLTEEKRLLHEVKPFPSGIFVASEYFIHKAMHQLLPEDVPCFHVDTRGYDNTLMDLPFYTVKGWSNLRAVYLPTPLPVSIGYFSYHRDVRFDVQFDMDRCWAFDMIRS